MDWPLYPQEALIAMFGSVFRGVAAPDLPRGLGQTLLLALSEKLGEISQSVTQLITAASEKATWAIELFAF